MVNVTRYEWHKKYKVKSNAFISKKYFYVVKPNNFNKKKKVTFDKFKSRNNMITIICKKDYGKQILIKCHLIIVNKSIIELADIFTNENQRGKGYGTILLNYVIDYCTKKGYKKIVGNLSRFDDVERLKLWYIKYGFEIGPPHRKGFMNGITKYL